MGICGTRLQLRHLVNEKKSAQWQPMTLSLSVSLCCNGTLLQTIFLESFILLHISTNLPLNVSFLDLPALCQSMKNAPVQAVRYIGPAQWQKEKNISAHASCGNVLCVRAQNRDVHDSKPFV